jgi:hypothetical protein
LIQGANTPHLGMIDLDEYLERVARTASEIVNLMDYAAEVLGDRHKNGDQTVVECVDFRSTVLSNDERSKLNWQLQLGFFPDTLPNGIRLGGYVFAAEVASAVLKLRMRTLCAPYRHEDNRLHYMEAANSRYLQNALASCICLGVRHSASNKRGEATITQTHFAREVATFKRLAL